MLTDIFFNMILIFFILIVIISGVIFKQLKSVLSLTIAYVFCLYSLAGTFVTTQHNIKADWQILPSSLVAIAMFIYCFTRTELYLKILSITGIALSTYSIISA